jgi:hypothetical protein
MTRLPACAVPFRIDGVSKIAIICWEHGNNDTAFMVVGCFIAPIANRKLRHRELHLKSSMRIISQIGLARLNQKNLPNRHQEHSCFTEAFCATTVPFRFLEKDR